LILLLHFKKTIMKNNVEISLIIPFYKKIDFLKLIFKNIDRQSFKNFEVIIAEDDNSLETVELIKKQRKKSFYNIQHIFQNDNGFRKAKIMNNAILKANGSFITFVDGDCIPHKHFLKEYYKNKEFGYALFGRRVMISEKLSNILIDKKSTKKLNIFNLIISKSKRIEDGLYLPFRTYSEGHRGLYGNNWGTLKKYLIEINGFDEDFLGPADDVDIEWRLIKLGLKLKKVKNKAIVYHLFHKENYTKDQVSKFMKLLKEKQSVNNHICKNGINKL